MKAARFLYLFLFVALVAFPVQHSSRSEVESLPYRFKGEYKDRNLAGPSTLAASPDGKHIYLACQGDETLGIFSRDPASGRVDLLSVEPLERTNHMLFSSDGAYLFTATSHSVSVFQRDPDSGALTRIDTETDGVDGVEDLAGANELALSPDEAYLYVTAGFDDSVVIFAREASTGQLSFQDSLVDGEDGVDGLDGAGSLALSPDGSFLYAAGPLENSLVTFSRNTSSGGLTYLGMLKDGLAGTDGLADVRDITISPDGQNAYTAALDDDAIGIFTRNPTTGMLSYLRKFMDGEDYLQAFSSPIQLAVTPDGLQVIAVAFGGGTVASFRRLPINGDLEYASRLTDGYDGVDGLHGVWGLAFGPGAEHIYTAAYYDHSLVAIHREASRGNLDFIQQELNATGLGGAGGLAVSPSGYYLYATGNNDDTLVVFKRDPENGILSFHANDVDGMYDVDGLDGARAVVISPGGEDIYVAGHDEDALAIFRRDSSGYPRFQGMLQDGVDGVNGLDGVQALAISPDGEFVYTAAETDDAVAVFQRNPTDGLLTLVEVIRDGIGGVDGLNGAYSLVVSPDGLHLLATGYSDHAVTVFRRDPVTGRLAFEQVVKDGDPGVDGLAGANSIAMSPDGAQVYVASRSDDTLTVFNYDQAAYRLSFMEVHKEGMNGLDSLDGARTVAVCPDGSCVAVAAQFDHTLSLFIRDTSSGALTLEKVFRDSLNAGSLSIANNMAFSPDGQSIYVAGYGDDGIAFFHIEHRLYLPLVLKP